MNQARLEQRLAEIEQTDPLFTPVRNGFDVTLPYGNISSVSIREEGRSLVATIEELGVEESLRKNGIGTRLIRTAFKHCADYDVDYVDSYIINPTALRNRRRVLGESALHFLETTPDGEVELPMTVDQACASIDRANAIFEAADEEEKYDIDRSITTRVYMRDVDTSGWD